MVQESHARAAHNRLDEIKATLSSPDQTYVCIKDAKGETRVVHRVPVNEADVRALFWKLEGAGLVPFARFTSLEYAGHLGNEIIATFQETEESRLKIMEPVEFEYAFEDFISHGHNPKETSLVICWEVRNPERCQKTSDGTYQTIIGQDTVTVLEIKGFPKIEIHRKSEVDFF